MMRSTGRGGPTAEELADYEDEGLTTERKIRRGDYGRPGMAPVAPVPKPPSRSASKPEKKEQRKYAKGGAVRGSGCEQRGLRKCKVV